MALPLVVKRTASSDSANTAATNNNNNNGSGGEGAAAQTYSFQAETKKLLNIVARSLYTDTEVFLRELVSNSSDALEKVRYLRNYTEQAGEDLKIRVNLDSNANTITIQDNGIGMSRDELITNLGTIAHSGSRAMMEEAQREGKASLDSLIGQFGVGFYSCFMVSDEVTVYSLPHTASDGQGHCWTSTGDGTYQIRPDATAEKGTKIVLKLKDGCKQFSQQAKVRAILNKYAAFLSFPLEVDGTRLNTVPALWTKSPSEVSEENHTELYRFLSGAHDSPMYTLHFSSDSPLSIRAVLYIPPTQPPAAFGMRNNPDCGVQIFSRRVLIQSRSNNVLPPYLHFLKGVIDCDDIPLNLSRERLQDSQLMKRIGDMMTARVLKWLADEAKKDEAKYQKFYEVYSYGIRHSLLADPIRAAPAAQLLRYGTSKDPRGCLIGLRDYIKRMKDGQKFIYFYCAPSWEVALASPYMESYIRDGIEVLLVDSLPEELMLTALASFEGVPIRNIEQAQVPEPTEEKKKEENELSDAEVKELVAWMETKALKGKTSGVKATSRLDTHPCMIHGHQSSQMRELRRITSGGLDFPEPPVQLLINPKHPIIKALHAIHKSNSKTADLIAESLLNNAKIAAGIIEDVRELLPRLNALVANALGIEEDAATPKSEQPPPKTE